MSDSRPDASLCTAEPGPAATSVPGHPDSGGSSILLRRVTRQHPGQGRPAVGGLSLEIPSGAVVTFFGAPGCGKSTVLGMLNRLVEPSSGSVMIGGRDVATLEELTLRRRIGYVVRSGGLFPHMTVAANVRVVPRMLGWERGRTAARVEEVLDLLGLDPVAHCHRYPHELAPGQAERVGMARALAAGPRILLLDDPFADVDPATRHGLQRDLLRIQRQLGITVVCATADLAEAMTLGDRVAVLGGGARLVQYDRPGRLHRVPWDRDAAGLPDARQRCAPTPRVAGLARNRGVDTGERGDGRP